MRTATSLIAWSRRIFGRTIRCSPTCPPLLVRVENLDKLRFTPVQPDEQPIEPLHLDRRKPLGEVLAGRGRGLTSPGERRTPPDIGRSRDTARLGGTASATQEISQFDPQREGQSVEDIDRNAPLCRFHLTHIRLTDSSFSRELLLGPIQPRPLLAEVSRQKLPSRRPAGFSHTAQAWFPALYCLLTVVNNRQAGASLGVVAHLSTYQRTVRHRERGPRMRSFPRTTAIEDGECPSNLCTASASYC